MTNKFTAEGNKEISVSDTPEQLAKKLYNDPDYFENNPRGYKEMAKAAINSPWHDRVCGDFNSVIPVQDKKLLDAGCATGVFTRAFRDLGADVYGIELSEYASGVAKKVIGEDRIHTGSIHDLSMFNDNTFDIYFTAEVIEHVPYTHHIAMLKEAIRVTKPNGLIYLQGVIGFKDYLNPDPNDDAGHIAVFPYGYWLDLIRNLDDPKNVYSNQYRVLAYKNLDQTSSWVNYNWQYIVLTTPN